MMDDSEYPEAFVFCVFLNMHHGHKSYRDSKEKVAVFSPKRQIFICCILMDVFVCQYLCVYKGKHTNAQG